MTDQDTVHVSSVWSYSLYRVPLNGPIEMIIRRYLKDKCCVCCRTNDKTKLSLIRAMICAFGECGLKCRLFWNAGSRVNYAYIVFVCAFVLHWNIHAAKFLRNGLIELFANKQEFEELGWQRHNRVHLCQWLWWCPDRWCAFIGSSCSLSWLVLVT